MKYSPPIPLFLQTLADNGALVSEVSFPISIQTKQFAERSSLQKAIADARSKAMFLASEHQRDLQTPLEITPVEVKIEEIRDTNLEFLLKDILAQQKQKQQDLEDARQREIPYPTIQNPFLNPYLPLHLQNPGSQPTAPSSSSSSSFEPLRVFSSSLVPKRIKISTQVKVKYSCSPLQVVVH